MTQEQTRAQFTEIVTRDEDRLELDRAALLIAAEEYPNLDIEEYLSLLDHFGEQARARDDYFADPLTQIMRLGNLLFDDLGFRGNAENYYDARNSFLNNVIERRTGIPITLSVVMMEVGRRIGLTLYGVGMPGHFLVKYVGGGQEIFADPFHGGRIVDEDRCRRMIEEMYNGQLSFSSSFLNAVTKKQILSRMLQNLKGIYAKANDHFKLLSAIERALLINPDSTAEIRDRAMACFSLKRYAEARMGFEDYLRREPEAADVAKIKSLLAELQLRQAQLN
ncbi:MAG: tetratricopeptide repeat protein [Acidobacteria bacterium]|nr:tetratricopeptide repeat protein [Acidobacteriota bacterium]